MTIYCCVFQLKKDPVRVDRQLLYWGICMPASCTSTDLERSLNETLLPIFEKYSIELNITVDPVYCHIKEKDHYTTGFYVTT